MKKHIQKNHNCIDVGCHKGEILNLMLKYSPQGKHFAFEPIPYLYKELKLKFENQAKIYPYALSNKNGKTSFQLVKNAPAYSGIKQRKYAIKNPEIEEIEVEVKTIDDIISLKEKIDFIKIDVEGGEFEVLKGAQMTLSKNKPITLFECGKGASDYYGTNPSDIYCYITKEVGLKVFTLKSFLKEKNPLSIKEFVNHFDSSSEYYFVAAKI
ncbi:FkbM family methyltransferase [Brumimicrobium mesophilum]|uniref:FkbM family methyltransferase n=1 Tax=Brumimicrobium mesophilum TaxID=392717 RepID=UPI00131A9C67|nr:FkbM family methyltransferase [Brumimicrobium mesophilum]